MLSVNDFVLNEVPLFFRLSVPPIIMCFGVSTIIGSGLVFATAVVYGMQVMGKK